MSNTPCNEALAGTLIDRFDDLFDPRSGWGMTTDLGWSSSALASDFDYLTSLSSFTLCCVGLDFCSFTPWGMGT